MGWKIYSCKTESGADFQNMIPANVKATVKILTDEEYNQNFATRLQIMSWKENSDASWFKE